MAQTCAIGGRCRSGTGSALAGSASRAVACVKIFVAHLKTVLRYRNREGFSTHHLLRRSLNEDDDDPEPLRVTFACPQERYDFVRAD